MEVGNENGISYIHGAPLSPEPGFINLVSISVMRKARANKHETR